MVDRLASCYVLIRHLVGPWMVLRMAGHNGPASWREGGQPLGAGRRHTSPLFFWDRTLPGPIGPPRLGGNKKLATPFALSDTLTVTDAANTEAAAYTLTAEGSIVTATNGRRYRVKGSQRSGKNTRRVTPGLEEDLFLVLDSPRARTMYLGARYANGSVKIICSA